MYVIVHKVIMEPDQIISVINNTTIYSNNMSDNEHKYHDLFLDREDKDEPKVVQVSPSSSGIKKQKKTENEKIAVMHVVSPQIPHLRTKCPQMKSFLTYFKIKS